MTARRSIIALIAFLLLAGGAVLLFGPFGSAGDEASAPPPRESAETREQQALLEHWLMLRDQMDRNFGPHVPPLALADSALSRGDARMALAAIEGALKSHPDNPELTDARALTLYIAADMKLTAPVRDAFAEARAASGHPGPDYFEGAAELLAGNAERAERLWRRALGKGAPSGEWRESVTAQRDALAGRSEEDGALSHRAALEVLAL